MKQTPKSRTRLKKQPTPPIPTARPTSEESYDNFAGFVELMREQLHRGGRDIRTDLQQDLDGFLENASELEIFFMGYVLSIFEGQRTHGRERGPAQLAEAFRLASGDLPASASNAAQPDTEVHAHMTTDGVTLELTARRTTTCRHGARALATHA